MVESSLVFGIDKIIENVCFILAEVSGVTLVMKGELKKLQSILPQFQHVLVEAEKQQISNEDVKEWLRNVKNALYDAEDLMVEFSSKVLQRKLMIQNHPVFKIVISAFPSTSFIFRIKMAKKVKGINETLSMLVACEKEYFKFAISVPEDIVNPDSGSVFMTFTKNFYGRVNEKSQLIEMLIDPSNQETLSVIPIVGKGGIGKTYLAQSLCRDERVVKHYDIIIWVCVSESFEIERLLRVIIESCTESNCALSGIDVLVQTLAELLSGKKFLLVLDDVRSEIIHLWDILRDPLTYGAKGSTIIVTTRITDVAYFMEALPPCRLGVLSPEESWSLFEEVAFGTGRTEVTPTMLQIAKMIVEECHGLPLALKASAHAMFSNKKEESEWLALLASVNAMSSKKDFSVLLDQPIDSQSNQGRGGERRGSQLDHNVESTL